MTCLLAASRAKPGDMLAYCLPARCKLACLPCKLACLLLNDETQACLHNAYKQNAARHTLASLLLTIKMQAE
eukprot:10549393-Prorocentrum_lima.AAC.1